jgi:hypothetical protein
MRANPRLQIWLPLQQSNVEYDPHLNTSGRKFKAPPFLLTCRGGGDCVSNNQLRIVNGELRIENGKTENREQKNREQRTENR